MSAARSNIGGRFVGRSRFYPWPVPGWFRAATRRPNPGPGGWCGAGECSPEAAVTHGSGWRSVRPGRGPALRPSVGAGSRVFVQ